jgi:effector-binding domain-containing protein
MIEVELVECAPQRTAVVHGSVPLAELPSFLGRAYAAVWETLAAQGIEPAGEPFAYFHGTPGATANLEAGVATEAACAPQGEVVPGELPGGQAVATTHVGPYEAMAATYGRIRAWTAAHGLVPAEDMWEVYLSDASNEPDPATWRTRIFWPVTPAPARRR